MRQFFFKRGLRPQGLLFLICALLVGGCATPSRVATRILSAPNLRSQNAQQPLEFWRQAMSQHSNRVESLRVPVSAPDAELSVLIFPPGDYGKTDVKVARNGDKSTLELQFNILLLGARFSGAGEPVPEKGMVFLLHGYTVFKETMIPWAILLARAGYRCVLVDLRGHGQSSGDTFSFGKFEQSDLIQVLDYLEDHGSCKGPVAALGTSFGANLALHWMNRDSRVQTAIAIAPFDDLVETGLRLAKAFHLPVSSRALRKGLFVAADRIEVQWSDWSGASAVRSLTKPVLFIAGGSDAVSPPHEVERLKSLGPPGLVFTHNSTRYFSCTLGTYAQHRKSCKTLC